MSSPDFGLVKAAQRRSPMNVDWKRYSVLLRLSRETVKLVIMNTSGGQVCPALSFTFPRGFTISGLDESLIPDPNTVLADFSVYLKPTLHRCCFQLDSISLDKSIA
ncbi:hypothetical protein ALC53_02727 [Atta colombica]|uniref:Uncharacterized protein n=1 Tax=Atta colombica TaxID=520822 RepID=A0A195BP05_9HYME|nr:hypothetical protein ALC53_02727 [Atta colombica]